MAEILSIVNLQQTEKTLKEISERCKGRLKLAEQMACTEETKQATKKLRAELNKEFSEYEAERKERTAEYEKPLKMFKDIYNQYIAEPFRNADIALKVKINDVETAQREEKALEVKEYADELKQAYSLDWLETERIIPNVTLSASAKSLKAAVKERLDKIKSDIDCIGVIDDSGEMFAEYMNCLDLAAAKIAVEKRKKAVEEAEKAKAAYTQTESINQQAEKKVDMLAPPVIEEEKPEEKKYTMTFTVSGTMEQLKAIKAFLIENNIEFKNGGNNNE